MTKKTPPPVKILWVQTVMLHLNEKIFYHRFDLTKKTPSPGENFMGANCNVTPQLKFFLLQIWLDQKDPPTPPVKMLWVQTVTLRLN